MKIVVLDGEMINTGDISWAPLQALGDTEIWTAQQSADAAARIGDAPTVLTNRVPITQEVMAACPGLRYVGLLATGYNQVDIAAAARAGITVCNVPGYSTRAVTQGTVALLLEITNGVGWASAEVHRGRWDGAGWARWFDGMVGLAGKTMAIIGLGEIGRAVAAVAVALGMRVVAAGSRPTAAGRQLAEYLPLHEALRQADVVSLHCPLNAATQGMINEAALQSIKPGAILLNTARGGLVDEAAVAAALHSGRLYAYGADVAAQEPIRPDNPLLKAPRYFITPHIAWANRETRQSLVDLAAQNLAAFLAGTPTNVIQP